jgi:hypothetical protein
MRFIATVRGFGVTSGMRNTKYAKFEASSLDGEMFDLTALYNEKGSDYCHRLAEKWGRANGLLRVYRRKASQRRFLAKIGRYA